MRVNYLLHTMPDTVGAFVSLGENLPAAAHLKNGMKLAIPKSTGGRLLFVLRGEADCTVGSWPLRLTAGGWVTLPADTDAAVHVYRSVDDACLLLFGGANAASPDVLAFGNVGDMPTTAGHPRLFGFESGLLTGQLLSEGETVSISGPAVVADKSGGAQTGDAVLPSNVCAQIPEGQACPVTGAKGTIVFRRFNSDEVEAYKHWMYETYAIRWESGLHHIAK